MADNKAIHKFQPGDVFHDRYTLEVRIGVGGFADVWKATDNTTNMVVALKIYTNLDEDGINDLSDEYTRMASLNHQNILKAEHFDSWGNIPYLVMKLCDGGSLDKKIGKLETPELMHVIKDIANGLRYLHQNKIVHQDIKPANVLIDNTGGMTTYVLSDFGISSKTKTRLSHSVNLKNQGTSMTEAYAPPEKFSAKKEDRRPDRKGDIFSFGISVYELVTGHMPFDDLSTGRQLQYEGVDVDFSEIQDDKIRRIVEHCMQRDKEDRPTADELVGMIASDELPAEVQHHAGRRTVRMKPESDNSGLFKVLGIILFLLIVGAAAAFFFLKSNLFAGEEAVADNTPKGYVQVVDTFTVNGVRFEMVKIPGGSFMMGSEPGDAQADECERPAQQRTVSDFYIGRYEVTQKLWSTIMDRNPSTVFNDNFPVNNVSWEDCQLFIQRLNSASGRQFRLPSEMEWEYAAKTVINDNGANTSTRYAGTATNIGDYGWYSDNSGGTLHAVGLKQPNFFGLYDMSGNVIEWCQDIYTNYATGNVEKDKDERVLRGGFYGGGASSVRCTSRGSCNYAQAHEPFGFRLCLQ